MNVIDSGVPHRFVGLQAALLYSSIYQHTLRARFHGAPHHCCLSSYVLFSATISILCPFKNNYKRQSMLLARRNSYQHFCINVSNSFPFVIKFCSWIIQYVFLAMGKVKVKQMRSCGLDTKFNSQIFTDFYLEQHAF